MPRLTPPPVDRAAASRAAVAARRARAEVKADIAAGRRSPIEVLDAAWSDAPPAAEASLRVREFLTSLPSVGPTRAAQIMEQLAIADSKRLGGLGVRQRARLRDHIAERSGLPPRGRLVVLAGPTAVGKGTVTAHIREHHPEVLLSISATTRAPRPGEVDGEHYYFLDVNQFDEMIRRGEFLEWAVVHGTHRYGTPRPPIEAALAAGRSVLLEIDLQGARQVRESTPEAITAFLLPPSWEELVRRLTGRGTEGPEEQARRLDTARGELAAQHEFQHRIINDEVSRAAQEVVDLLGVSARREPAERRTP